MSADILPTLRSASWNIVAFRDAVVDGLKSDRDGDDLLLFLYSVTSLGWKQLGPTIASWLSAKAGRKASAFVGTDHGLTDPEALRAMVSKGVQVYLLLSYVGVYHPKSIWLLGPKAKQFWIGSNNLTEAGLADNIELASVSKASAVPESLLKWKSSIESSSELMTEPMLKEYERERKQHNDRRAKAEQDADIPRTFVWSRRRNAKKPKPGSVTPIALEAESSPRVTRGDLVMEIMARETGGGGKQVQFPKAAALKFFRMPDRAGATKSIVLSFNGGNDRRTLTATVFDNKTIRLSLSELEYSHRRCVVVVRPLQDGSYNYEIVSEGIRPQRYASLIKMCVRKTRKKSRRWVLVNS